jgi:hypothetical protein
MPLISLVFSSAERSAAFQNRGASNGLGAFFANAAISASGLLNQQQSYCLVRQLCAKGKMRHMAEVNWSGHALSVAGLHLMMEEFTKQPSKLKKLRLSACGLTETCAGEQIGMSKKDFQAVTC